MQLNTITYNGVAITYNGEAITGPVTNISSRSGSIIIANKSGTPAELGLVGFTLSLVEFGQPNKSYIDSAPGNSLSVLQKGKAYFVFGAKDSQNDYFKPTIL